MGRVPWERCGRPLCESGIDVGAFLFPGILHDFKNIFSRLKINADLGCITESPAQRGLCLEGMRDDVDSEGRPLLKLLSSLYTGTPFPARGFVFPDFCSAYLSMLRSSLAERGVGFYLAACAPVAVSAEPCGFMSFFTRFTASLFLHQSPERVILSHELRGGRLFFLFSLHGTGPSVWAAEKPFFPQFEGNPAVFSESVVFSWMRDQA